jgi:hypothetical protein
MAISAEHKTFMAGLAKTRFGFLFFTSSVFFTSTCFEKYIWPLNTVEILCPYKQVNLSSSHKNQTTAISMSAIAREGAP